MTTLIGVQGNGWVVLASDSRITTYDQDGTITAQSTLPHSKITQKGPYLIGAAGDVRAINLLHHAWTPPEPPTTNQPQRLDQHITKKIIPSLRQLFDEHGYSPPDTGGRDHKAEHGSNIIIALKARLYIIEQDYSWTHDTTGIYTTGTGEQYAKAILTHLYQQTPRKPTLKQTQTHIRKTLQTVTQLDPYTGTPIHIHTQTNTPKP
ncbi:MAG: hypothetical protein ACO3PY_05025 [Pontimonas sp.]